MRRNFATRNVFQNASKFNPKPEAFTAFIHLHNSLLVSQNSLRKLCRTSRVLAAAASSSSSTPHPQCSDSH